MHISPVPPVGKKGLLGIFTTKRHLPAGGTMGGFQMRKVEKWGQKEGKVLFFPTDMPKTDAVYSKSGGHKGNDNSWNW